MQTEASSRQTKLHKAERLFNVLGPLQVLVGAGLLGLGLVSHSPGERIGGTIVLVDGVLYLVLVQGIRRQLKLLELDTNSSTDSVVEYGHARRPPQR